MTTAQDIAGIMPAMVTPMKPDGSVDGEAIGKVVDHVFAGGVKGIVPIGGTGEYSALSTKERAFVVEKTVEAANGRGPVVASVLSPGYQDAMEVGTAVKAAGADAVMLILPYYATGYDQEMADYVRRFREEIDLPVVFYEIPEITGVTIGVDHIARLAEEGTIIGMKFSDTDIARCGLLAAATGENFSLLCGQETLFAHQCLLGARGGILAAPNVFPKFWVEALRLATEKKFDALVAHMAKATPMLDTLFCETNPAPIKTALRTLGIEVGAPRLPIAQTSADGVKRVEEMLGEYRAAWA